MFKIKWILFGATILIHLACLQSLRAEETEALASQEVQKSFLIVKSTPSYREALKVARSASRKLGYTLNLRSLSKGPESALTFSKEECARNNWDYPCYTPRGRYDDGIFVSIETSSPSYYPGFEPGYFIVIAAGGDEASKSALPVVKQHYPDAYIKSTRVWMGCAH